MLERTVLRDVLISQEALDRYYEGRVPVNLWRALNVKRGGGLFDLIEEAFKQSNGRVRPADISIANGWVKVDHFPRGISTFDKPGVPRGKDWTYYRIPEGTPLPRGLAIVKDSFNESYGATHYTIAPDREMPLDVFRGLLTQLARHVVKEAS